MTFRESWMVGGEGDNGKLYDHSSGRRVFPNETDSFEYLITCLEDSPQREQDFFIAISFGNTEDDDDPDKNAKMIDFFAYSGVKENWGKNTMITSWRIKNGVWRYDPKFTCGEGSILLGREGELRLRTRNLQEYLKQGVDLKSLNRVLERR